jgi:hypothetical protein
MGSTAEAFEDGRFDFLADRIAVQAVPNGELAQRRPGAVREGLRDFRQACSNKLLRRPGNQLIRGSRKNLELKPVLVEQDKFDVNFVKSLLFRRSGSHMDVDPIAKDFKATI